MHAAPPNASFFCLAAKNRGGWATALLFVAAPPFDAGANVTVWRVCANYFTGIFDKAVASVSARNTTQASLHIREILTADDVNIEMACYAKRPLVAQCEQKQLTGKPHTSRGDSSPEWAVNVAPLL